MVDGETLKWFTTLGVGGVLAGFMFMFYRKDAREWRPEAESVSAYEVISVGSGSSSGALESVKPEASE